MISIDKLIFSFHITQFETIENALENDSNNNDFDFDDYTSLQGAYHQFNRTKLQRVDLKEIKTHFRENHWVYVDNKKIALLQWGTNGTSANYGYMTLCNNTFYNGDWVLYKQALQNLSLTIHNISRLDIAFDSVTNPTKRYETIVKDKENQLIYNGVRLKDRDKLLESPYFNVRGSANDIYKYSQIQFNTKDKSTICRTYNKSEEVATSSHKNYIIDLFKSKHKGSITDIYRCEVSMNSKILFKIIKAISVSENIEYEDGMKRFLALLEDNSYLLTLHRESMNRMFRYRDKRGKLKSMLSYYIRH